MHFLVAVSIAFWKVYWDSIVIFFSAKMTLLIPQRTETAACELIKPHYELELFCIERTEWNCVTVLPG